MKKKIDPRISEAMAKLGRKSWKARKKKMLESGDNLVVDKQTNGE